MEGKSRRQERDEILLREPVKDGEGRKRTGQRDYGHCTNETTEPVRTKCQQHGGVLEVVYSCRFATGGAICKGQFKAGTEQPDKASIGSGASGGGCPLELQVAVRHQCDLQTAVVGR